MKSWTLSSGFVGFIRSQRWGYVAYGLFLAGLSALSYGLVISKLGIYWDDWAFVWTRLAVGYDGLLRHFSFSRPVAGQLHNLSILLTGGDPLRMQLFAQGMRIAAAVCFAALLRSVWRSEPWRRLAWVGGLLYFVYPGFTMIPIAINFGFSYFLMGCLFVSWLLSLRVLRGEGNAAIQTAAALLLSALNLFASEYFFLLELVRPVLYWVALEDDGAPSSFRERSRRVLTAVLPYALVFGMGLSYRLFFNKTQTLHYEFSLLTELKTNPAGAIREYLSRILDDSWRVLVSAWGQLARIPDAAQVGSRTRMIFIASSFSGFLLTLIWFGFVWMGRNGADESGIPARGTESAARRDGAVGLLTIAVGAALILFGGQPYWLTGSYLSFIFPNSRYTLSFLPGVPFVWLGAARFIGAKLRGRAERAVRWVGAGVFALTIGLSCGFHFLIATEYRRDWTLTRDFFRQLSWRIPDLEPKTAVVTNSLPIRFSTDNSLTAPLNWIYADASELSDASMPFMLYTNTKRAQTMSDFAPGRRIEQEYLTARFSGNTSDTLSLYYRAPGCVHVLDPEIDIFNQTIPEMDRMASLLTNYGRIRMNEDGRALNPTIFGSDPSGAGSWCEAYERADLARQRGDYETVAALGDAAFAGSDYPNDPMERLPFIEGYAMIARWADAERLTGETLAVTRVMNDPLCSLWRRIERNAPDGGAKETAIRSVRETLDCDFLAD